MTCKEFEHLTTAFMGKKLDYPTLKAFADHLNTCSSCKEELTIQFLVSEGIQHLEEGDSFDLKKELNKRLQEVEHTMKWHKRMYESGLILQICSCVFALIGILLLVL